VVCPWVGRARHQVPVEVTSRRLCMPRVRASLRPSVESCRKLSSSPAGRLVSWSLAGQLTWSAADTSRAELRAHRPPTLRRSTELFSGLNELKFNVPCHSTSYSIGHFGDAVRGEIIFRSDLPRARDVRPTRRRRSLA